MCTCQHDFTEINIQKPYNKQHSATIMWLLFNRLTSAELLQDGPITKVDLQQPLQCICYLFILCDKVIAKVYHI